MRFHRTHSSRVHRRAPGTVRVDVILPCPIHDALLQRVGKEETQALAREIIEILMGVHPPVAIKDMTSTFFAPTPTLEELAAAQQVSAVAEPVELFGNFWPEDETTDDFIAALRTWRKEDAA